jgi:hypothetical protein
MKGMQEKKNNEHRKTTAAEKHYMLETSVNNMK